MTRKMLAVLGSALFLIIAPGIVAGFIPWWISKWNVQAPFLGFASLRALGALLLVVSVLVLLESFARFALQGVGTPVPVFPTRHLVVKGLYRYVRNPMYLAVASIIFGQAMILGSKGAGGWPPRLAIHVKYCQNLASPWILGRSK